MSICKPTGKPCIRPDLDDCRPCREFERMKIGFCTDEVKKKFEKALSEAYRKDGWG